MSTRHEETWLPGDAYDALRAVDFHLFCTAAGKDLTAGVPTCPEWGVTGLCDHLARVYQGRSMIIETGAFPDAGAFVERGDANDPVDWVRRWSDELDRALLGRSDDAPTVSFMPDGTTVHFWRRRMALETIVHRTDAEIAVGDVSAMDPELSADGVDEMLWFVTHPSVDHADGIEGRAVVELTDATRSWRVGIADGLYEVAPGPTPPDAVVRGSAPALLLAVSGRDLEGLGASRFGVAPLVVEGDEAAFRRLSRRFVGF